MNWTMIKCLAAHTFADYGAQTSTMAQRKNDDAGIRALHIACVAGAFAVALATDDKLSITEKLFVIFLNTITHFAIDSFRIPKGIDQALHSGIAVGSVYLVNWRGNGS